MKPIGLLALRALSTVLVLGVAGCAVERAQVAHDPQARMVDLTKEHVLS
jgi:hypothetical protein